VYTAVRGRTPPKGKRVQTGGRREAESERMTPRERWRMAQLIICAAIFVSLVAVKLNMPAQFALVRQSVSEYLYSDSDYKSAFAIIGRAASGQESAAQAAGDLYTAVFAPKSGTVETSAAAEKGRQGNLASLLAFSRHWTEMDKYAPICAGNSQSAMSLSLAAEDGEDDAASAESGAETVAASAPSDKDLPSDVCMEQKVLNISYVTPLKGTLSSPFGYREHPIEGEEKFHYGIDIAAGTGTAIGAFAAGTVSACGESTSLGKYVMVSHGGGITTLYAHCSKLCTSTGKNVRAGQKIAEVGATGLATGPHCHFQLEMNGTYLNPIYYVSLSA
jgi:murein DD-endopeptidase MepM/ murein hydrolase activator NlpD